MAKKVIKQKEPISRVVNSESLKVIIEKVNLNEKLASHEKIWFDNQTGVRKAGIPFAFTKFELEEYAKCKISVEYFAEHYCQIKREDGSVGPLTLRDYQKEILDLYVNNRFSILMASRQMGKTVSAAIVILHFCLFNNDKNVMIVANKGKTVEEIISKIKDIYRLLPFFIKKGVKVWNERSISFENGCRVLTERRTKSPSIGFTIDFLYLDEFAKVPSNIIDAYYGAVVPVVSSVENSKIIITSTPEGFNLFHKLLTDAERDEDDPLKNPYKALRVHWFRNKKRKDTRLYFMQSKLKVYEMNEQDIVKTLKEDFGYEIYSNKVDNKYFFYIKNDDLEHTSIQYIRNIRIGNVPLQELCIITNWKEEETKLIGSEDQFKQEYDLLFVTGDRLLFDSDTLNRIKEHSSQFEYIDFEILNKYIGLPYNKLRWLKGRPDIFDKNKMKDYYICASIDLGEGLGGDYTVINLFRIIPKSKEEIESNYTKYKSVYDYFQLVQIGALRVNNWSINEVAELFYMLMFEVFDPEKCKTVLEYNKCGGEFTNILPYVYNESNNFSNGIFLRYKHRKEDTTTKVGLKVTGGENDSSKKMLIKDLQDAVKLNKIVLYNDININELSTFVKKDTIGGNYTYRAESGHDDMVMTAVNVCTVFKHPQYKNLIDIYMNELDANIRDIINKYAFEISGPNNDNPIKNFSGSYSSVYNKGNNFKNNPNDMRKQAINSVYGNKSPFGIQQKY